MAETRKSNRLAGETSPYLLQHAQNPVDWYPWGEEAFEKARCEGKPIFLSVGYSSCHWCHVMERESFEDEEVARVLNDNFVSIKVDREERPDVDAIYMSAVQLIAGQGGWPMSVFLTPDLRPFYGGTYFPRDTMYGRPGFIDILNHLVTSYRDEREQVDGVSADIMKRLAGAEFTLSGADLPTAESLDLFFRSASGQFDSTFGGFGGAPKFPHAMDLSLLLRYWKRSGERLALDIPLLTLRKMAGGGMYDQVGGGFHRYSVDREWLVPHFEKMLYDNGLLARTYFEGYQASGDTSLLRIGREILDYVLREMTDSAGGFYAATDADSDGEEGTFFVWTPEEVEATLGRDSARLLCLYYNITVGGNFEKQTSVPNITRSLEEIAAAEKLELGELAAIIDAGRKTLRDLREQRTKPFRDEKVVASWNGLMLSAMARGFQVTGDPRYGDAAEKAAGFIEEELIRDGVLHRIWKGGATKIPGYLDDYACVAEAFIDLHESTFDARYLERAVWLTEGLFEEFGDDSGGGFFYSSARHDGLIHRRREFFDNVTPSGTWVTGMNLLRLAALTGETSYGDRARSLYRGLHELVEKAPMGFATALAGVDFMLGPVLEVAVIGERGSPATRQALEAVHRRFIPSKVVTGAEGEVDATRAKRIPLLEGRGTGAGQTTVYLCEQSTCQAPIVDVDTLEKALDEGTRRA